jgi:hypothetical protein
MVKSVFGRLRHRMTGPPQQLDRTLMPQPPRPIYLGLLWPWAALIIIVAMHPSWGADQVTELLACFTPYIMLAAPPREGRGL